MYPDITHPFLKVLDKYVLSIFSKLFLMPMSLWFIYKYRSLAFSSLLFKQISLYTRIYLFRKTIFLPFLLHIFPIPSETCSRLLFLSKNWSKICSHLPFLIREAKLTQIWGLLCDSVSNRSQTPPAQVNNLLKMQNGSGGGSRYKEQKAQPMPNIKLHQKLRREELFWNKKCDFLKKKKTFFDP